MMYPMRFGRGIHIKLKEREIWSAGSFKMSPKYNTDKKSETDKEEMIKTINNVLYQS